MAPTKGPGEGPQDEKLTLSDGTPVTAEMVDKVAAAGGFSPEEEKVIRMKVGAGLAPGAEMVLSDDPQVLEIEASVIEKIVTKGIFTPDEDGVVGFPLPPQEEVN